MATRKDYQQSVQERRRRIFSIDFKQKKVREIEQRISTIAEISRQYDVSPSNIHKWIAKFGLHYQKQNRTIVETESDTRKLLELKARLAELEQLVGQKQIQLDFKDKMIELAEELYGIDIKKKFGTGQSFGSGSTGKP